MNNDPAKDKTKKEYYKGWSWTPGLIDSMIEQEKDKAKREQAAAKTMGEIAEDKEYWSGVEKQRSEAEAAGKKGAKALMASKLSPGLARLLEAERGRTTQEEFEANPPDPYLLDASDDFPGPAETTGAKTAAAGSTIKRASPPTPQQQPLHEARTKAYYTKSYPGYSLDKKFRGTYPYSEWYEARMKAYYTRYYKKYPLDRKFREAYPYPYTGWYEAGRHAPPQYTSDALAGALPPRDLPSRPAAIPPPPPEPAATAPTAAAAPQGWREYFFPRPGPFCSRGLCGGGTRRRRSKRRSTRKRKYKKWSTTKRIGKKRKRKRNRTNKRS